MFGDFGSARDATPLWAYTLKNILHNENFLNALRLIITRILPDNDLSTCPMQRIQKKIKENKCLYHCCLSDNGLQASERVHTCARNGRDIAVTDALFEQGDFLCVL